MGALPVMEQNLEKVGNTAPFTLEDGQAEGSSAIPPAGKARAVLECSPLSQQGVTMAA